MDTSQEWSSGSIPYSATQGFPKGYHFARGKNHIAQQLANAVPVELAYAIGEELFNFYSPLPVPARKRGMEAFV